MSLNRMLLRMTAVAALSNGGAAPYPTIGQDRIFDSRIEPLEHTEEDKAYPIAIVYTDYDADGWRDAALQGMRKVTLTIELLVGVTELVDDGSYTFGIPQTDSELETSLDIFEWQVQRALQGVSPAAQAFRGLYSKLDGINSRRGASIEGGNKLAVRQVVMDLSVPREGVHAQVAAYQQAALDALASTQDFSQRASAIQGLLQSEASGDQAEHLVGAMGWTLDDAGRLGIVPGAPLITPPDIVWLDPSGEEITP